MADPFRNYRASPEPAVAEALVDVLQDCVEGGASVGFMHPLPRAKALTFWQNALAGDGRGERIVLVAEAAARAAGRTLLVLDTVTGSDAERLYARLGWQRCGVIPGYALGPRGGPCSTTVFYRVLAD